MKACRKRLKRVHQPPVTPMAAIMLGLALMGSYSVQAADVSEYAVLKGKQYSQLAAGTPTDDSTYYWWTAYVRISASNAVSSATAQPPGMYAIPLVAQGDPTLLEMEIIGGWTESDFNEAYPNGNYTVAMSTAHDGDPSVTLNLSGDAYPNTPTFLDFSGLSAVNPSETLTLDWTAFSGGGAADFIEVQVSDDSSHTVFMTPAYGTAGALNGTATSVEIPADTLTADSYYMVKLTFIKVVTADTTSYSGATGLAGYYKHTTSVLITSAGTGGGDSTPPELLSSTPTAGQFDVPVTSPVSFVFNESMTNAHSIAWSANVNPAGFTYSWSGDGRTLTCSYGDSFPATALITWALNPAGEPQSFMDAAGNPLPEDAYSGSFFTSYSSTNPCTGYDDGRGAAGVIKELLYLQDSAASPVPDPETPAVFMAAVTSPTNDPVLTAKMQVPGGPLLTLSNLTGVGKFFMTSEDYASQEALDTARPNGTYVVQLTRTSGAAPSANISVSGAYPPIPQIQNYTACQSVDPAADFTVQWNGFAGASEGDIVAFTIMHPASIWSWSAPDPCIPRALPNTATSVTIPADTLESGTAYEATLIYSRMTHSESNGIPDIDLTAYLYRVVRFSIVTTGSSGDNGARFSAWSLLSNGNLELELQGTAGQSYIIETAGDLMTEEAWSILSVKLMPLEGKVTFEVPISESAAFIRAESL